VRVVDAEYLRLQFAGIDALAGRRSTRRTRRKRATARCPRVSRWSLLRRRGPREYEVLRLLATVGIKVLIIDEIQHVLAGPTTFRCRSAGIGTNLPRTAPICLALTDSEDALSLVGVRPI
jgi:hypothetical protein